MFSRYLRRCVAAALLVAPAFCGALWPCKVGAVEKPDVLVVICDQWSPRFLSWDNPQVRTPQLDAIAREGLIFDACYTTSPVCMPARVSLVSGLYPHNAGHSIWGNLQDWYLAAADAPMFRDIRAAGYSTAQIGKLHWFSGRAWSKEFQNVDDYHRAVGLDHVIDVSGPPSAAGGGDPYSRYLRERGLLKSVAEDLRERYLSGEFEPRVSVAATKDYHDVFVTDRAVDYIGQHPRDRAMCLVVSLHAPHPPLDAPGEYATMYEPQSLKLPPNVPESFMREKHDIEAPLLRRMLANYLGKISLADHQIGRLVEAMRKRGTWENTLFVFTADHGEMMGAHGALTKGRFYEEAVRVPLVMRLPGTVKSGRTQALAQMMDVYPTIVEAVGGTTTPNRFAVSQWSVATGVRASSRNLTISEIEQRGELSLMARNARYKWWVQGDDEYLFDLQRDPWETKNLANDSENAAVMHELRGEALTHLRTNQLNLAAGGKSKVQRLREEEANKNSSKK